MSKNDAEAALSGKFRVSFFKKRVLQVRLKSRSRTLLIDHARREAFDENL